MVSTASVVMSPTTTSSRAGPASAESSGGPACLGFAMLLPQRWRVISGAQTSVREPGAMNADLRNIALSVFMGPGFRRFAPAPERQERSSPLRPDLGRKIDRAPHPDVVEMRVDEVARGAPAAVAQHHEEIIVGAQLAVRVKLGKGAVERDAVQLHAAILAGTRAARQPAFVDQPRGELDRAQLAEQRRVEGDLVHAVHDLLRGGRR